MYRYVAKAEVKPYKARFTKVLQSLCRSLRKQHDISSQVQLIGSGARNLVTRDGNGPFDLDYNLILQKIPDELIRDPGRIKSIIRTSLDQLIGNGFSYGQDSTASLTYVYHDMNGSPVFHFDLGIIRIDDDGSYRLINDKKNNAYIWNKVMDTRKIAEMAQVIRKKRKWDSLRNEYLELKNRHLSDNDSLPSYDIYAEAVNHIYTRR